jgi:iron complex outermembrane recepter protein
MKSVVGPSVQIDEQGFAKFYLELDNIADKKYAASGQIIGGETAGAAAGQQAFFAGYGRAIYGGVTLGLF